MNKQQVKTKLRKGDTVIVIAGKNKGKTGLIEKVDRKHQKVFVENVNIAKKHSKPNSSTGVGGIIDKVMPIAWSNVAFYDAKKKAASRLGYKIEGDKKVRFSKKSGAIV